MTPQSLFQLGTVALHPTPDRCVIRLQPALGEQFFDIAQRERVAKVPPHGTKNQLRRRLSPLSRSFQATSRPRQSCNTSVNTELALRSIESVVAFVLFGASSHRRELTIRRMCELGERLDERQESTKERSVSVFGSFRHSLLYISTVSSVTCCADGP
jgi:hypothetical protein